MIILIENIKADFLGSAERSCSGFTSTNTFTAYINSFKLFSHEVCVCVSECVCVLTDSGMSVLLGGVVELRVECVMDLLWDGGLLSGLFSPLLLDELSLLTSFSSAGISSQYLKHRNEES